MWISTIASWCVGVLLLSVAACLVRLLRGPHAADRVIALDLIALLMVAILGVLSMRGEQTHYLATALVLALVSFLTTVAWSFYIRHQSRTNREQHHEY